MGPIAGKFVLVIEDEVAIAKLCKTTLERRGYVTHVAHTGTQALEFAKNRREAIDLAILDINIPEISGDTLLAELAKSHPETRILYTSGFSDQEAARTCSGINESNFLQKPFLPKGLLEKVAAMLGP